MFWNFGLTSAAGGLTGALLQGWASNRWLNVVFGALLLFAAASELTGLGRRMRFRGYTAWIAGALSGLLGGLVGNQGGLRSAALLGFDLSKRSFVATASAVGLLVDGARMPVYLVTQAPEMADMWLWIVLATIGVTTGTVLGSRVLARFRTCGSGACSRSSSRYLEPPCSPAVWNCDGGGLGAAFSPRDHSFEVQHIEEWSRGEMAAPNPPPSQFQTAARTWRLQVARGRPRARAFALFSESERALDCPALFQS